MNVHSMCELGNSKLAVACYENIFVWDLLGQELLVKIQNGEESIKKVMPFLIQEHSLLISIDAYGLLSIWDGSI